MFVAVRSALLCRGGILYKETITEAMEGVGHYEPLRHYAEVHLKLEPLPRSLAWESSPTADSLY